MYMSYGDPRGDPRDLTEKNLQSDHFHISFKSINYENKLQIKFHYS